jgi:hypothetical protein
MNKTIKLFSLFLISISFSSCIELVEEIDINSDLSGQYHLIVQHQGLDFLLDYFTKNIDISGVQKAIDRLKHQSGISSIKSDLRPEKGKFSIEFHFDDSQSLNRAFYTSLGVKKQFYHKNFIKIKHKKIKRPNLTPYLIRSAEENGLIEQIPSEKLLKYISYRYHLILPENIRSTTARNESVSSKEFIQNYGFKALLLDKESTKSIIRLQP